MRVASKGVPVKGYIRVLQAFTARAVLFNTGSAERLRLKGSKGSITKVFMANRDVQKFLSGFRGLDLVVQGCDKGY